ncbi:hypothetical protein H6A66_01520 [Bacteroides caecigallinarum]|uniref:hypothetical protein n=1 Tax=Bacteroides caecigallinarum TaxID=1411144 RepID=UPI00195AD869|nr:hypothetical protein [Bacteroides caecigallinarum]MBM6863868.1 hypothetical protein [Bacteroides caecigallinarum]
MAEKKELNVKETIGCLLALTIMIAILVVFTVIVQSIPVLLPPIFLIAFIVNYTSWRKTDRFVAKRLKFWLTDTEKRQYIELSNSIVYYHNKKKNAQNAAVNEGIRVNQNGRLSAKSYRGQDLQGAIDESEAFLNENIPILDEFQKRPRMRWKTARKHFSKSIGFGMAIMVWFVFFFVNADNIVDNYSKYVYNIGDTAQSGFSLIGDLWKTVIDSDSKEIEKKDTHTQIEQDKGKKEPYDEFLTVFIKATFFMIVAYFIALIIGIIVFRLKYRKPPLVNASNVISSY